MTVRVLGTGGTIAASLKGDAIQFLSVADLCEAMPSGLPSTEAFDLVRLPSSALQPSDMLKIAREVRSSLRAGVEGVVVTHGTDTLEETAFLTALLVGDDSDLGGVVFTGAMRFASDMNADGPGNLADAIKLAASHVARGLGVLVAFGGEIHAARWVTKATTSGLQPFVSPTGAIGRIGEHKIDLGLEAAPRWPSGYEAETRVALVKAYLGMSGAGLEALILEGIRGVVIEGFGVLNVPESLVPAIAQAIEGGVAVVVASVPSPRVDWTKDLRATVCSTTLGLLVPTGCPPARLGWRSWWVWPEPMALPQNYGPGSNPSHDTDLLRGLVLPDT